MGMKRSDLEFARLKAISLMFSMSIERIGRTNAGEEERVKAMIRTAKETIDALIDFIEGARDTLTRIEFDKKIDEILGGREDER